MRIIIDYVIQSCYKDEKILYLEWGLVWCLNKVELLIIIIGNNKCLCYDQNEEGLWYVFYSVKVSFDFFILRDFLQFKNKICIYI